MKKKLLLMIFMLFLSCNKNHTDENIENSFSVIKRNNHKSIIFKDFHKNGNILNISFVCDSIIVTNKENVKATILNYSFYSNGNLKEKRCQGTYNGTGVPVGTWFEYDSNQNIIKTTYYKNDVFGKDYILIKYFKKNVMVNKEKFNNYILYENEKTKL